MGDVLEDVIDQEPGQLRATLGGAEVWARAVCSPGAEHRAARAVAAS